MSVVVPLFNERECVEHLLQMLRGVAAELGDRFQFEFLLVDDGSTDGTAELLERQTRTNGHISVIRHGQNRGIAAAIHTGIVHSRHEVVASIDSDGSYDPLLLEAMVPLLTNDVDLVIGSPYHTQGSVENVPRWRLQLSRWASVAYRGAMRHKLTCYTSCFRVYRREPFLDLATENSGFVGVAELVWKAETRGLRIVECPARLRSRLAGVSKMRTFRASLQHVTLISRIAIERFKSRLLPRHTPSGHSAPLESLRFQRKDEPHQ